MVTTSATWPADVIHVNEDGWVLINRGRAHGVAPGLRLFVVGAGARELRDLFASGADAPPTVLRTRRTYDLLEVVHAEERCAIAVAARVPSARRPEFYHGPTGELLVWVPLPIDYTWPPPPSASDDTPEHDEPTDDTDAATDDEYDDESADAAAQDAEANENSAGATDDAASSDDPPARGDQEDVRWEQALPLNGVSVGDIVIPAVPAAEPVAVGVAATSTAGASATGADPAPADATDSHWEKQYDWMQPKPDA
jgi:hypothetical protein